MTWHGDIVMMLVTIILSQKVVFKISVCMLPVLLGFVAASKHITILLQIHPLNPIKRRANESRVVELTTPWRICQVSNIKRLFSIKLSNEYR